MVRDTAIHRKIRHRPGVGIFVVATLLFAVLAGCCAYQLIAGRVNPVNMFSLVIACLLTLGFGHFSAQQGQSRELWVDPVTRQVMISRQLLGREVGRDKFDFGDVRRLRKVRMLNDEVGESGFWRIDAVVAGRHFPVEISGQQDQEIVDEILPLLEKSLGIRAEAVDSWNGVIE